MVPACTNPLLITIKWSMCYLVNFKCMFQSIKMMLRSKSVFFCETDASIFLKYSPIQWCTKYHPILIFVLIKKFKILLLTLNISTFTVWLYETCYTRNLWLNVSSLPEHMKNQGISCINFLSIDIPIWKKNSLIVSTGQIKVYQVLFEIWGIMSFWWNVPSSWYKLWTEVITGIGGYKWSLVNCLSILSNL